VTVGYRVSANERDLGDPTLGVRIRYDLALVVLLLVAVVVLGFDEGGMAGASGVVLIRQLLVRTAQLPEGLGRIVPPRAIDDRDASLGELGRRLVDAGLLLPVITQLFELVLKPAVGCR
jgi:hypothetical protein